MWIIRAKCKVNLGETSTHMQAPEIMLRERYDARVDLWSVGVILYGKQLTECI